MMADAQIAVTAATDAVRTMRKHPASCGTGNIMAMTIGALLATTYSSSKDTMSKADAKDLTIAVLRHAENIALDWIENGKPIDWR